MIQHHPGDDLLLALAAGTLDGAQALVVSVHLEACGTCRARLGTLQAIGGALLDAGEPAALAPGALERALQRIDAPVEARERVPAPQLPRPSLPEGVRWPSSLRNCGISTWHWMAPGMRWSRVTLPYASAGSLFLLRIAPGWNLARHGHSDLEFTQVLCGSFDDGRAVFGPGDFDVADEGVHHQPIVQAGSECVCLAFVGDRLRFDGWLASLIGRAIGM